ncbi:ankyrin, partial [Hypomontagnella submonticulosa]
MDSSPDLFGLSVELVQMIFDQIVLSRTFKRVMRCRLVNRHFRDFIDQSICRLRLLSQLAVTPCHLEWARRRMSDWNLYICSYLAHQARIHHQSCTTSSLGRIYRAAQIVCEGDGDTETEVFQTSLKSLIHLAINRGLLPSLLQGQSPTKKTKEPSESDLKADVFLAAIRLGQKAYVERLITEDIWGCCANHRSGDISSHVFGPASQAAILQGNLEMVKFLLRSKEWNDTELKYFQVGILRGACLCSHRDAFYFAIDLRPINLHEAEYKRNPVVKALEFVRGNTRYPDIYDRVTTILETGERDGSCWAIQRSVVAGNAEMVRHHLPRHHLPYSTPPPRPRPHPRITYRCRRTFHLLSAVRYRDEPISRILLDYGVDPNSNPVSQSCLPEAVWAGSVAVVRLLLDRGADINRGCPPPIVMAVFKERLDMFYLLRERGAELHTPETGAWAMALAKSHGLDSMVDLLVREGVDEDMILHRVGRFSESTWVKRLCPAVPADERQNTTKQRRRPTHYPQASNGNIPSSTSQV